MILTILQERIRFKTIKNRGKKKKGHKNNTVNIPEDLVSTN